MWLADFNRQWTMVLQGILFLACALPVRKRLGWIPAMALLWFMGGSIAVMQNSFGTYDKLLPHAEWFLLSIQAYALDSIAKTALVVGFMLVASVNTRRFEAFGSSLAILFLIVNCAVIIGQYLSAPNSCQLNQCGGLVGNPSMSGSLMVALLPLCSRMRRGALVVAVALVSAAVYCTHASAPVGLLAALAFLVALRSGGAVIRTGMVAGALVALVVGWSVIGKEFTNSGDRVEMWTLFLSKWQHSGEWMADSSRALVDPNAAVLQHYFGHQGNTFWLGIGMGTFDQYAAALQRQFDVKTNSWWLWSHCDWPIGIGIEGGLVGLVLFSATFLLALRSLIGLGMWSHAASLVLYGLMMPMNYPLHLASTAMYGCWLVVVALSRRSHEQRSSGGLHL